MKDIDNLDAARARMVRDPEGLKRPEDEASQEFVSYAQARYAANMVASLLAVTSLVAAAIGGELQEAPARAALEAAHSEVLEAGITSLSPSGRLRLVMGWADLQQRPMAGADGAALAQIIDRFAHYAASLPNPEQKVALLEKVKNEIFTRLDTASQDKLIAATFTALDTDARLVFIRSLASNLTARDKVTSCLRTFFSRDPRGTTPAQGVPLRLAPNGSGRIELATWRSSLLVSPELIRR